MLKEALYKRRALTLGSGCKLAFVKHTEVTNVTTNGNTLQVRTEIIKPVLILTGINNQGMDGARISTLQANACVGIITSNYNATEQILDVNFEGKEIYLNEKLNIHKEKDWLTLDYNKDRIVYPRIFINSLQLKTDSNSLIVSYLDYNDISLDRAINYLTLKQYEDYSVLTRSLLKKYAITLDPELVIKQGIIGSYNGIIQPRDVRISYSISNADTSIYLDALEVAKLNSMPKVSYDVKCNIFNSKICETLYNKIGNIIRINDNDLKFKNVRGYISGFSLDLDNPDNDNIEVKNYKTKFEDLFSTITAQTELMKKNNGLIETVSSAFTSTGDLTQETLQSSIMKVDLDYAFDNGKLTIDEHNGIWGTSDTGVVAFRGGGIFTSTEKDSNGNWKWNTGITPLGINASLISTGQLDTNLIKIYSGDNLRFQMNGDGIFAYKSRLSDSNFGTIHPEIRSQLQLLREKQENHTISSALLELLTMLEEAIVVALQSLDGKQYVLYNDLGISLIAKKGAKVLNSSKNKYKIVLSDDLIAQIKLSDAAKGARLEKLQQIKRVEVSWDGFILRNWHNEKVFLADPDTGNLIITGTINATGGHIGAWNFNGQKLWADTAVGDTGYTTFVALNAGALTELHKANGDLYPINQQNFTTNAYCFWAGSPNPFEAPFSIKKNGELRATNGQIGGWTMDGTFFYNKDALIMAPGGASSNGSVITTIDIYDDEGNKTGSKTQTISLNGMILWVPTATWRTQYNNKRATILDSINGTSTGTPLFSINNKGDILANTVNGSVKSWFNGYTFSKFQVKGYSLQWTKIYPDGSTEDGNFNGANGVTANITGLTLGTNSYGKYNGTITVTANALYPNSTKVIPNSGTSENYNVSVSATWQAQSVANGRPLDLYIGGIVAKTITIHCDSAGNIY